MIQRRTYRTTMEDWLHPTLLVQHLRSAGFKTSDFIVRHEITADAGEYLYIQDYDDKTGEVVKEREQHSVDRDGRGFAQRDKDDGNE